MARYAKYAAPSVARTFTISTAASKDRSKEASSEAPSGDASARSSDGGGRGGGPHEPAASGAQDACLPDAGGGPHEELIAGGSTKVTARRGRPVEFDRSESAGAGAHPRVLMHPGGTTNRPGSLRSAVSGRHDDCTPTRASRPSASRTTRRAGGNARSSSRGKVRRVAGRAAAARRRSNPRTPPSPGARWIRRRFRDKRRARTVVEARDGGRHGQRAPDGVAARGRRSPGRSGASSFPARARVLARDRVRSRRRAPRSTLPAWSSPESSAGSRRVTRVVVTARSPLL